MRNYRNDTVFAKSTESGMNIYAVIEGRPMFIMTHRYNNPLFFWLCNGKSIEQIRAYRPHRIYTDRQLRKTLDRVLLMVEYVKKSCMTADLSTS